MGEVLSSLSTWFDVFISHQDLISQVFSVLALQKSLIGQNVEHCFHPAGSWVKSLLFIGKKTIKYYYENKN